jgi:hypothetical protein
MKLTKFVYTEHKIKYVRLSVPVIEDEDDIPKDFPFRIKSKSATDYDRWDITIDLDTKKIVDWPQGIKKHVYMRVSDEGSYWLLDADKNVVSAIEKADAPIHLIPVEYGAYINLDIRADGSIRTFKGKDISLEDFPDGLEPKPSSNASRKK